MNNCWIEIELSSILNNLLEIKKITHSKMLAVIKADAYGHGAIPVSKKIKDFVDMFGVFSLSEAISLRENGIKARILLLGPTLKNNIKEIINYNLTPSISTKGEIEALSKSPFRLKVHIKIDTGMGRLGIPYEEAADFIKDVILIPNIEVEGIFSHLATAYLKDKTYTKEQFRRFSYVVNKLKEENIEIPLKHIANSAAILDCPDMHLDMVRPGILLYGLWPSDQVNKRISIKPAMSFKTRIISIKRLKPSSSISYGQTYITEKESLIGVIPVGYSHGLRRALSNKGYVLVKGKRAKIVGTICMDMTMIDLSEIPNPCIGDEVCIFGSQDGGFILVDEIAGLCNTINYEIITGIKAERIYK